MAYAIPSWTKLKDAQHPRSFQWFLDEGLREELLSFLKADLKLVQQEKDSLMPSYKSALSETEVNDLVARLNALRGKQ